jgi:hypothetical protein
MIVLRHGHPALATHPAHPGCFVPLTDSAPVAHDRRPRP